MNLIRDLPRRAFRFILFILLFLRELVKANVEVVVLVLRPRLKIRPGFIAVPITARGDFELTTLANAITLTPGTISVHIPADRSVIVLHALDVGDDPQLIRDAIHTHLEKSILAFTRPAGAPPEPDPPQDPDAPPPPPPHRSEDR